MGIQMTNKYIIYIKHFIQILILDLEFRINRHFQSISLIIIENYVLYLRQKLSMNIYDHKNDVA